jgi:hypothetical protein
VKKEHWPRIDRLAVEQKLKAAAEVERRRGQVVQFEQRAKNG